ncbi:MAG: tRNA (adenosine(37)-N6)-dimethylallyltransferase MiaA [Bacteroidetes bacterium]|nr:tRNA (adenosine(37)-N6)-dimethylallyltransferase MiaA [Bacteroidota bacterium]
MSNLLIVILGPTGIGKTDVAIKIATELETYIISADSRQVFKELNIGTAIPDTSQLKKIKHFFIQHKSIHDYYSASIYEQEVISLLKKIFPLKEKVVMAGGSGLYIDAVCEGIDDIPDVDPEIRKKVGEKLISEGTNSLRNDLRLLDPESYKKVDLKNPKRIQRAVEICLSTGKPYSSFLTDKNKKRDFKVLKIGLNKEREELYEKINNRVENMIKSGFVEEARELYQYRNFNSLNTVGYKELFDHFDGKINLTESIELIKRNTRRYAKRQLTWFQKDKNIHWFEPSDINKILELVSSPQSTVGNRQ